MDAAGYSLNIASLSIERHEDPFVMPWHQPGNPSALLTFHQLQDWQTFIANCSLQPAILHIVSNKFIRAQRLYVLA